MTIKILLLCTFINGMLHLAYLGQMLEKGGRFTVRIFPEGWYLVRIVLIYSNGVHSAYSRGWGITTMCPIVITVTVIKVGSTVKMNF